MIEIDLGKIWLPNELVDMVDAHRMSMLEYNKHNHDVYELLNKADFGMYLSDFLAKNCYKMIEDRG